MGKHSKKCKCITCKNERREKKDFRFVRNCVILVFILVLVI